MVNATEEVRVFLGSKKYTELAREIIKKTRKTLCVDLYEVEVEFSRRSLNDAELNLLDVDRLIEQNSLLLEKFSVALIKAENSLRVEQEFTPSEPEEKEEDSHESYVGHGPTFLLTFSILFLLLGDRKNHLSAYLKKARQPSAKKYQRALEEVY
ncbi:hypothetical protein BLL42_17155 [Pseudomonas frederiksbergensis]|uniref:Uncharacterized protein n=1 Tax=Pseudomonas frederiksbergensis TaxID=104087 RepID=A0A1J0EMW0_9PSED|nr:hypothetical protein [Pseudomonas frederiksbergensis]APC17382.1 hypothetical protein BLL42_17155 [Pseudomonas frederiksbergensis]